MTRLTPDGPLVPIHEAAATLREKGHPLIVVAGDRYGAGSSRDWAAKGPWLPGIRTVLACSFERIRRRNLICMGILPGFDADLVVVHPARRVVVDPGRLECHSDYSPHEGTALRCAVETTILRRRIAASAEGIVAQDRRAGRFLFRDGAQGTA